MKYIFVTLALLFFLFLQLEDPSPILSKGRYRPGLEQTGNTSFQLKSELFYLRYDLITAAIIFYFLSLFFKPAFFIAFTLHTTLILLRIIILERPPVSNMQESLLFVPWVASLLAFKGKEFRLGAAVLSCILLSFGKWAFDGPGLEVAPAVLNSRFWLTIHVLMVVSSYAFFLLAGILAHIQLIKNNALSKTILQILYTGTFFLISGTILGGVWAQQSWGRFWDWDPKESWAFISSCLYLVLIHLYRFGHIREKGLSIGAILGILSIGFTWYGVNYLLGTGLHSYGFGSGGAFWFILFCLFEGAFLLFCLTGKTRFAKWTKKIDINIE